jgi:DNA-binding NtrC family response regulator
LRERIQDVPALFGDMLERFAPGDRRPPPPPSAAVLAALMTYAWSGNVRELENLARLYAASLDSDEILAELKSRSESLQRSSETRQGIVSLKDQVRQASKKLESEIILKTLERHRWNRRRAAQVLNISYRSLLYKMKHCEIRAATKVHPVKVK